MNFKNLFLYREQNTVDFMPDPPIKDKNYRPQLNEKGPCLSGNFKDDKKDFDEYLSADKSGDIKTREFTVRIKNRDVKAIIYFIDGLVNKELVNDFILNPLMIKSRTIEVESFRAVFEMLIPQCEAKQTNVLGELSFDLNFGSVILFIE